MLYSDGITRDVEPKVKAYSDGTLRLVEPELNAVLRVKAEERLDRQIADLRWENYALRQRLETRSVRDAKVRAGRIGGAVTAARTRKARAVGA